MTSGPADRRVCLLLRARPGSYDALAAAVENERRVLLRHAGVQGARAGHSVDPLPDVAHTREVGGRFDAYLEVALTGEAPADAVTDGIGERMAPWCDLRRSGAGMGDFHPIVPAVVDTAYLLVYALRPRADRTPEVFFDRWLNVHGVAARDAPGPPGGYGQLHFSPDPTAALRAAMALGENGHLGVALAGFDSVASFTAFLGSPAVAAAAIRDERRFIDVAGSALALVQLNPDLT